MAACASSRSTTVLRYVGFPLLVRTIPISLQRDFWACNRSREGPAILKEVCVNILSSLGISHSKGNNGVSNPCRRLANGKAIMSGHLGVVEGEGIFEIHGDTSNVL